MCVCGGWLGGGEEAKYDVGDAAITMMTLMTGVMMMMVMVMVLVMGL